MSKSNKRRRTPRSQVVNPSVDAVPLPSRRRKPTLAQRPPAELPEPVASYTI